MSDLFRKEVLETRGNALFGGVALDPPRNSAWLAGASLALAFAVVAGTCLGSYARKETVPGFLVPTAGLAYVTAARPGIVERVLVGEGDYVEADEHLLQVGSPRTSRGSTDVDAQQVDQLKQDRAALDRQIAQEQELSAASQRAVIVRMGSLRRQQTSLQDQLASATERARLLERDIRRLSALRDHVAPATMDGRLGELLRTQQELSALHGEMERLGAELQSAATDRRQMPGRLELRLAELHMALTATEREIAEVEHRRGHIVRAPVSGRVTALTGHVGMAVTADQPLLIIVPEGTELQAELLVPTRAIGFVQEDQIVRLRYDAFPYQKFGLYPGKVKSISRTVLSPRQQIGPIQADFPAYRVLVALDTDTVNAYGLKVSLQPGLTLQADIIRDRRRIIEWVFDPIIAVGRTF